MIINSTSLHPHADVAAIFMDKRMNVSFVNFLTISHDFTIAGVARGRFIIQLSVQV